MKLADAAEADDQVLLALPDKLAPIATSRPAESSSSHASVLEAIERTVSMYS